MNKSAIFAQQPTAESRPITFVQQPTSDSCVSACLAMLLGIPVERVLEEFHDRYKAHEVKPFDYLAGKIQAHYPVDAEEDLEWDRVYLLGVPSLNIRGGMHAVLLDTRGGKLRLYDPNVGKAGREYYFLSRESLSSVAGGVLLTSWAISLYVTEEAMV